MIKIRKSNECEWCPRNKGTLLNLNFNKKSYKICNDCYAEFLGGN